MIKLIDFGFAAFCKEGEKLKIFCGTPSYMSPQMVLKDGYFGQKVDIWAAGILLYTILMGFQPFKAPNED